VGGLGKDAMQSLFETPKRRSLLGSGWSMVANNKRYIVWFWLMNLTLAELGTGAFRRSAHAILDHSSYADRLLQGFHFAVLIELLSRPEFGPMATVTAPAVYFAVIFFLATALFLPGVFQGYASPYRLPREDFFRACGRNLWRFIRLMIMAGIVMFIIAALLFAANRAIVREASESTHEVLPFELQMVNLFLIFLVMTTLRIWFDLAEADIVLNDQRAVRKSVAKGFRHAFRSGGRLLGSYVLATIVAAMVLVAGLRAFLMSQVILFLLLIPRFWQRGIAVGYWQQNMLVPVAPVAPTVIEPMAETLSPQQSAPVAPTEGQS
jgi:hypothetical protein